MNELFDNIIEKFKNRESIADITQSSDNVTFKTMEEIQNFLINYLSYIQSNYSSEKNMPIFYAISSYLKGDFSIVDMCRKLFTNHIKVDDDKRNGYPAQFKHCPDETFFDEFLRVIYEFSRTDVKIPLGVCYDFCLFILSIATIKKETGTFYLWNTIEKKTGENNFIIIHKRDEETYVYDPFNAIYTTLQNYSLVKIGFNVVEINRDNLLKLSMPLTTFDTNVTYFTKVLEKYAARHKDDDRDILITLQNQNYYERLGLEPSATTAEIKKAYRILIKNYHPDLHPDMPCATEISQLLTVAYECLQNPELRKKYDLSLDLEHTKNVDASTKKQSASVHTKPNTNPTNNIDENTVNEDIDLEILLRNLRRKFSSMPYEIFLDLTRQMRTDIYTDYVKYNPKPYYNIEYDIDNTNNIIEKISHKNTKL